MQPCSDSGDGLATRKCCLDCATILVSLADLLDRHAMPPACVAAELRILAFAISRRPPNK